VRRFSFSSPKALSTRAEAFSVASPWPQKGSEVDPSIVGHEQESRVSDRPTGKALPDDPLAEAVLRFMVFDVGDQRSRAVRFTPG
jgi:hypothetical protein